MLKEFTASVSNTPVHVNPDHVLCVLPEPNDPENITIIILDVPGERVGVNGNHQEVAKKLSS
jgi:hypothetical protein